MRRPPRPAQTEVMDNGAAVMVRDLRKSYRDVTAVNGIDLEISCGEVFALLGPNGAGKTTTVEILEGFRTRDGGTVTVLGQDPAQARQAQARQVRARQVRARQVRARQVRARQVRARQVRARQVRAALPGRADHRLRPGGLPPVLAADQGTPRRRRDHLADHALPGRGGGTGRPDRGHRGRPHRRRGRPGNPGRPGRRRGPGQLGRAKGETAPPCRPARRPS